MCICALLILPGNSYRKENNASLNTGGLFITGGNMTEIIIPIITAVAGFVAGALVYRKHTKESERIIKQMQDANAKLQKRLDSWT